jgi:hypothetical protein
MVVTSLILEKLSLKKRRLDILKLGRFYNVNFFDLGKVVPEKIRKCILKLGRFYNLNVFDLGKVVPIKKDNAF